MAFAATGTGDAPLNQVLGSSNSSSTTEAVTPAVAADYCEAIVDIYTAPNFGLPSGKTRVSGYVECTEASLVLSWTLKVYYGDGTLLRTYSDPLVFASTPYSTPGHTGSCTVGRDVYATFTAEVQTPDGEWIAPDPPAKTNQIRCN